MSNKIDALLAKATENAQKAEQLRADIEQIKNNVASYEAAAERAAEVGDVATYKSMKQKAADAGATMYVKQASVRKFTAPCARDDARVAWEDFQSKHDAEFTKKLREYNEGVKKQCARFKAIIEMQKHACDQRKALARLAGMSDSSALEAFKFAAVNGVDFGADRAYFLNRHEITGKESMQIIHDFFCSSQL